MDGMIGWDAWDVMGLVDGWMDGIDGMVRMGWDVWHGWDGMGWV